MAREGFPKSQIQTGLERKSQLPFKAMTRGGEGHCRQQERRVKFGEQGAHQPGQGGGLGNEDGGLQHGSEPQAFYLENGVLVLRGQ